MKIAEVYSHLNGLEFLLVRKKKLYEEIKEVIEAIDAAECRTKKSQEQRTYGTMLYSPRDMNAAFRKLLREKAWEESRVSY